MRTHVHADPQLAKNEQDLQEAEHNRMLLRVALASHPVASRDYQVAQTTHSPAARELLEEHNRHISMYAHTTGVSLPDAQEELSQLAYILNSARHRAEATWRTLLEHLNNDVDKAAMQAKDTDWVFDYANSAYVSPDQIVGRLRLLTALMAGSL